MYKQRLRIFIILCILAACVSIGRLAYLQLELCEHYRHEIEQMRLLAPTQLPTIRGNILDRNGSVIAADKPVFWLQVNYELTRLLDDRVREGIILEQIAKGANRSQAEQKLDEDFAQDLGNLMNIIDKCSEFKGWERDRIEAKIYQINDRIWRTREFFAWSRKYPDNELKQQYRDMGRSIPVSVALEDFEERCPDEAERIRLTLKVDLSVTHENQPLVELENESELLEAQVQLGEINGVYIWPEAKRMYPYGSSASQIIGWVGPAQQNERELFEDDDYSRYLDDEVSGKSGVEKVCEVILRGKRGEVVYDIDSQLIDRKPTQFGRDVSLTLDMDLQRSIELCLTDPNVNPNYQAGMGAVVIDVATGEILAMVSLPNYDLNTIRYRYNDVVKDPAKPLMSKCMVEHYPSGSVIKPFILIMGLEEGKIGAMEAISCPPRQAPKAWPNCLLVRLGSCHDYKWDNHGRNAIKGSCNVYFSRLADRLDSKVLQKWLFDFGFGHRILPGPAFEQELEGLDRYKGTDRDLPESCGQIATQIPSGVVTSFEQVDKLQVWEKRHFGIGQGNFRATVLQVANAMAIIARGGIYKSPQLFAGKSGTNDTEHPLKISEHTLSVVRDGMRAVVNEQGGSGYSAFRNFDFDSKNITVYGKTGSTEGKVTAWFAGFATDKAGRTISLAIVIEGGQRGGTDAAPLGREIIRICNETGYIGDYTYLPSEGQEQFNLAQDN